MYKCTIIGISDSRQQWFPPHVRTLLETGKVFSGGSRHHDIMLPHLPDGAQWINITVPLSSVFKAYEKADEVIVFASGDPLFYGFAATVRRECPACEIHTIPTFHSLQLLAHRMCLPYQDMRVVSLTGRPWDRLDEALLRNEALIGCLTDHQHTPAAIWERMQTYGYTNYRMTVGALLGNEEREQVVAFQEGVEYAHPNCVILEQTSPRTRPFGIPDQAFQLLDGRTRMITKMPIRLCTLSALDLSDKQTFWDIGCCTGSISIEAKLHFPHLHIHAFERREEGRGLMQENTRRFGTPGIHVHIGDFCTQDLSVLPAPDAVFIGGHGGQLADIVSKVRRVLPSGGCIVFNAVSEVSRQLFTLSTKAEGMTCEVFHHIALDQFNPITILKARL